MRKRDHNILTNGASMAICGLLAGVVVAAAAFPAVAMSGLATKAGIETFDKLPTQLKDQLSPQITRVYAADNKTPLALFYDENRRNIPLKDVAPIMQKAIIAAEDHTFYEHNGVDVKGIVRAFVANRKAGQTEQGASTLTMQYVRMSLLQSAVHPRDVVASTENTNGRKLREIRQALAVEQELSKDKILEHYLNMAPFGHGSYGIFAASQVYFSKHPRDLTIDEAALLAGLVKAPSDYDPTTASGYPLSIARRDYIIKNMQQLGFITAAEATAAKTVKLKPKLNGKRPPTGCESSAAANNKRHNDWGFFCDYFYRWWLDQEAFGATQYDRERRLKSGGYNIITTLDPATQSAARKNVSRQAKDTYRHALMVAAVEPGSGHVKALATNREFGLDDPNKPTNRMSTDPAKARQNIRGTYPKTTNPLITGGNDIEGYQAGSTFKMFTLAAALESGLPLATTIRAVSPLRTNYGAGGFQVRSACPGSDKWCPKNADPSMNGVRNMWTGFGRSVNTYFVKLEEMIGADKAVEMARRLGIEFRNADEAKRAQNKSEARTWGAFTLGVSATTPLDLANAYATLAADGKKCEPIPVREIRDHEQVKLDVANPRCKQVVDAEVARAAVDAGRCPLGDRSSTSRCDIGTAPGVAGEVGKPVFGKTGTTDGEKTASLVVSAKQLAVAGILADPDWADTTAAMNHEQVNPAVYGTLRDALKKKETKQFTPPKSKMAYGEQRQIPGVRCLSIDRAREELSGAGFDVDVNEVKVESECPANTVASTVPDGTTVKGGFVSINVSRGRGARPSPRPGQPGEQPGTPPVPRPR